MEHSAGYLYAAILVSALGTYLWRAIGVGVAGRLNVDSAWIAWITCVAYALLAGLIARMLLMPSGPLAETPLIARIAAAAMAAAVFFGLGRRLLLAVTAGSVTLVLGSQLAGV